LYASATGSKVRGVPTILLCGVDLFFRGKLEALLPEHHFIAVDHTDAPDLVIADISRVDAVEVADAYPDVPILGYTNHTDTAGLKAAHAAGFDQVIVKSALVERARELVEELTPSS
jgi:DNA-binding NarL/FixJ family response regulator